jgi:hemerythrin
MYEMKKEYETGISLIDDEHRELFRIANTAYDVLKDEFIPDKFDHIVKILNELRDYTKQHFADEEAYMEKIQYKRRFSQVIDHAQFIEKIDAIDLEQLDSNQSDGLIELLEFLGDWLVNHILAKDVLIGK